MTGHRLFGMLKRRRSESTPSGVEGTLTGCFELRVDRIVGWVTDSFERAISRIHIEVLYHGRIIAARPATWRPEHWRFEFNIPIEGRFTSADLVTEDVTIIARDDRGNTGRMLLDGATQLELIREHLGVPCVTVLDLDFSSDGNARPYLGDGWWAEEGSTWTTDDESLLSFDASAEPGIHALRLTAGAFIQKPELPRQTLKVFLNDTPIDDIVYTEPHAQFREIKFAAEALGAGPRATLRLHHPDAARPSEIKGSPDIRRLAFNFKRVTIVRLLESE
jgi:hypothetical protein